MVACKASRTAFLVVASNETLFRKVGDVSCKDWEDTPNKTIGANHIYPIIPRFPQWLKKRTHTVMEDLIAGELPFWLGKALKFGDGNIANQDCSSGRWFAPCGLLDVTDRKIDGPCRLISTEV
jgi:hypothetical protein